METEQLLLSTSYLPPIAYLLLLKAHPHACIEIHETYPRQTWRNRCRIYSANGVLDMSIPVTRPGGNHTKTKDVLVSDHLPWRKTHWQTMAAAYARSPYFMYYADLLAGHYKAPGTPSLAGWNMQLLQELLIEFGISTQLQTRPEFIPPGEHPLDFRYTFTPKPSQADWGQHLPWPRYTQTFGEKHGFIPNLSCIDLLFNLGPDAAAYLESCLELYFRHVPPDRQF